MRLRQGFKGAWIALLAVALDRASKAAVLRLNSSGPLAPGLLNLAPVENAGMAFSMFSGRRLALIALLAVLLRGMVVDNIPLIGGFLAEVIHAIEARL